jgi:RimJ/RimL family protein N-acetyltransferase
MRTARLTIEPLAGTDVEDLMAVDDTPGVRAGVDPFGDRLPRDADGLRAHEEELVSRGGFYAVRDAATGAFVGVLQFEPRPGGERELGYRLDPGMWGRGYAGEAAEAMVRAGLAQGVGRVFAHALETNVGSIAVMRRAGLEYVGPWSYKGLPGVEYAVRRSCGARPASACA